MLEGLFTRNVFSPCPLLPPLKLGIVPMVTVWITDKMGDRHFLYIIVMTKKKKKKKKITDTG